MTEDSAELRTRFAQLVELHRAPLSRLARYYEANRDRRRDLEQEILFAIWRALPSFRGEASEKTFLLRVAHNTAVRHVIKQRRQPMAPLVSEPAAPSESPVEPRSELRWLLGELRGMDLLTQQVMLLSLEGLSMAEIGEVTGLAVSAVTSRLNRCRATLKARRRSSEEARHDGPRT